MPQKEKLVPAAEFQALPLGFIVAEPLKAAVNAQAVSAETTYEFINKLMTGDENNKKPVNVEFETILNKSSDENSDKTVSEKVKVTAPLLSIVPIPHLRIDSITTHFKYEISSIHKEKEETNKEASATISSGKALSPWVKASFTGSISSNSSSESVMNRSGVLEITVNASEAPMPEGLAKIHGILSEAIAVEPKK